MNIFVLDTNPVIAAQYLCDKHIVKMCLETAQIMCSVQHLWGTDPSLIPYKATHKNHPSVIWAATTQGNYSWLGRHGRAIGDEYTARFGKQHKSTQVINVCIDLPSPSLTYELTPFAQCMPDIYKHEEAVKAYRAYYKAEKHRFAQWKTTPPYWW